MIIQFYLDPFLARSVLRLRYGRDRFGTAADRAYAYVNTEDPVPFTDTFPRAAEPINVSSEEGGHWLPIRVFEEQLRAGEGPAAQLLGDY
jgi:hypothetical protein